MVVYIYIYIFVFFFFVWGGVLGCGWLGMCAEWILATPNPNPLQVACKEGGFDRWLVDMLKKSLEVPSHIYGFSLGFRSLKFDGHCKASLRLQKQ